MKKEGYVFLASVGSIFTAIIILFSLNSGSGFGIPIRLFALLGLVSMFVASMITPFQKELYKIFKVPFLKIHHFLTIFGLTMITLHPVLYAIERAIATTAREGAKVFLPVFTSAFNFWLLAGRPALIIIYIAVIGALIVLGLSVLLMRGTVNLEISKFFKVTSILLLIFGAGLAGYGVHELIEAGEGSGIDIGVLGEKPFDINPPVNPDGTYPLFHEKGVIGSVLKALVGYDGNPEWLRIIVYIGYWIVIGTYLYNKY